MRLDIRTKLFIAAIFSILALAYQDPRMLAAIFLLSLPVLTWFRVPLRALAALRKFIFLYFFLILLQSFFVPGGEPLLTLGKFTLLTSGGIIYGISILLRFFILAGAGLILAQCNQAELLLALVKLRLPYEIVFMVQLGIRFIPILSSELQNMFNGIQLRGVDLRKIYKRKVLAVYVSLFTPLIYSIWQKAEKLSILLELRGFRLYPDRTYYRDISLQSLDYAVMTLALAAAALVYAGSLFLK